MAHFPDDGAFAELVQSGLESETFSAYYQPKFDPDSEDIVGLEALLRWLHPSAGFLEAGQFMGKVERSEALAQNVDAWVLRATTRQARSWLDEGFQFGLLNVNISAWRGGAQLVKMVDTALQDSGLPAKSLALECPWRMLAVDGEAITATMRDLRRLGCVIVLDGNPLDQACLEVVRQTPVQMSKVCIEHFQEIEQNNGMRALTTLVKNWRKNGVEVVSMGVEHEGQVALSHKAGCQLSQGNRFKSPLPADEISYLLKILGQAKRALSFI